MISFTRILIVLGLMFTSVSATELDRNAAPFGLEWGMTVAQLRARGVAMTEMPVKDYGASYTAVKLSKALADLETVALSFGYDDKLWRVAAISRDFSNDPYGAAALTRYDELANVLTEKYGRGTQHHQADPNRFAGVEDFLMSIRFGRAWHYTDFATDRLEVQLGVIASDSSTASYRIIYKNKILQSDFEKSKKAHEKDAL